MVLGTGNTKLFPGTGEQPVLNPTVSESMCSHTLRQP